MYADEEGENGHAEAALHDIAAYVSLDAIVDLVDVIAETATVMRRAPHPPLTSLLLTSLSPIRNIGAAVI